MVVNESSCSRLTYFQIIPMNIMNVAAAIAAEALVVVAAI